jgi:hypothetical protein
VHKPDEGQSLEETFELIRQEILEHIKEDGMVLTPAHWAGPYPSEKFQQSVIEFVDRAFELLGLSEEDREFIRVTGRNYQDLHRVNRWIYNCTVKWASTMVGPQVTVVVLQQNEDTSPRRD